MTLAFTGTSKGMTPAQFTTLRNWMRNGVVTVLHHGDCVGADAAAHDLALASGARVEVHPPTNDEFREFCMGEDVIVHVPRPYLRRNQDLVNAGVNGLLAAPRSSTETLRSGTWSTVRYARKMKRNIWIFHPDGRMTMEPAHATYMEESR